MPRSLLLASTVSLGLLSGFIFVLVILLSIFVGDTGGGLIGAITTTIVINFLLWLVSPWFSDWMYRFFYKNQWTTLEELAIESPKTAEIIRKICEAEKIKLPKIGIIPDDNPNAFTYGSGPWNARIIITHGIIRFLSDEERSSVVAHELGHIANRDFIIMTVASTLLQILYEIYYYTTKQKRGNNDKKSNLAIVGLIAYIFYWLGSYILLYLSRVREYSADAFSAKYTDANLLADALIKIAMGILSTPGDARLVKSTRYIGVAGDAVSKQLGLVYKNSEKSGSFELLGRSLLFDIKSPWAFLAELSSTHPLSGKRINALMKQTVTPKYDLASIEQRIQIDTNRLYQGFARDLTLVIIARLAPWILGLIAFIALLVLHIPIEGGFLFVVTGFLIGIVLSMIIKLSMMYPSNQDEPTTILEAMGDIYASPVRGRKISLDGQLVGRGIPGYIFSEDMLMQDKTGLIYVDYESRFGSIGNLFYSLKKAAENIGKDVTTSGWFFRDMSSRIVADRITGEGIDLKGGVRLWMMIGIVFMTLVSGVVGVVANNTYTNYKITEQPKFIATNKEPTNEDFIAHPNWKFRDQYDVVYEFSNGLAKVIKYTNSYDEKTYNRKPDLEGIIDINGNVVLELGKYWSIQPTFEQGFIFAITDEGCQSLNSEGKLLKNYGSCRYMTAFSSGVAVISYVRESDIPHQGDVTYSVVRNDGTTIVPEGQYSYISEYNEGIATILNNNKDKIGFIDQNGKLIIPPEYDLDGDESNSPPPYRENHIGKFIGGHAVVSKNGKYGIIDINNTILVPFQYEAISEIYNKEVFFLKDKNCGIMNEYGKVILILPTTSCRKDQMLNSKGGYLHIKNDNFLGDDILFNLKGEKIIVGKAGIFGFEISNDRIIYKNQRDCGEIRYCDNGGYIMRTFSGEIISQQNYKFFLIGEPEMEYQGSWKITNITNDQTGFIYPDGYIKWVK